MFEVDLDHLDQVTARIGGLVGFVTDSLTGLDTRISALHQEWTGATATAHDRAHREWVTGANEVREGVDAMRAAAHTAHQHYSTAIATNRAMFGR
ncbi:WXG100 family type VII secretion target [Nocardia sp. NPDC052566]|uniref:WXG100 family type VII secretion target n=1 Tax=Nocardia sp. NPDC052566 TaxID=3364330 RepID=UPI0037CAA467